MHFKFDLAADDHPIWNTNLSYGPFAVSGNFQHGELKTYTTIAGLWDSTTQINDWDYVCFVAGTKAVKDDWKTKNIENVKVGEQMMTFNEKTNKFEAKRVANVFEKTTSGYFILHFKDGSEFTVTKEHPWLTNNGWVSSKELKPGSIVRAKNGFVELVDKNWVEEKTNVYNFETEDNHTYLVGSRNPKVVHNLCVIRDGKALSIDQYQAKEGDFIVGDIAGDKIAYYEEGKELATKIAPWFYDGYYEFMESFLSVEEHAKKTEHNFVDYLNDNQWAMDFLQGAGSEKELSFRRDLIRVAQYTVGFSSITELDDLYVAIQIQGHKVGEPLNNSTHLDGSRVTNSELTILTGALFLPFSSKLITKLGPDFMRGAGNLGEGIAQSFNNISQKILKGQAPNSIKRLDYRNLQVSEQPHIHFKDGSALNVDGSWKHGNKSLSNKEIKFLREIGWTLP